MAYFKCTIRKLGQCIYASATHKATQNARYFSSINRGTFGSTIKRGSINDIMKYVSRIPCAATNTNLWRQLRSNGDKDLVEYLKDEISFVEDIVRDKDMPTLKNFDTSMDGTVVTLRTNFNGENIEVVFNCNDNDSIDGTGLSSEDCDKDSDDEDILSEFSYPTFTVTICKPSGKTLVFNCNCYAGIDGDNILSDQDGKYDILLFDSVLVYNTASEVDKVKIYEWDTGNKDNELYSMLLNILLERGINGAFVNDLIDLSTSVEHKHYLSFLKSLKSFMSEN